MQTHENQSSSAVESTSSAHIKRYRVTEQWSDYEVTLEVDHSLLTDNRAQEINEFWSGHEDRMADEDGDEVKAVIRLAGARAVGMMLSDGWGGANFGTNNTEAGRIWSEQFREQEGWGGEDETPFGWCGIRIIAASAELPGFDEFTLEEVEDA
ncbi:MAG: DUF2528 family protein [Pseudomonadaceae bacterium]